MARSHSMRWLSRQARTGLRELSTNAASLFSRAKRTGEAAGSAAAGTRDKARELTASVVAAAPAEDSVDTRMKRARAAAERAQESKDDALEAARWSKESSDRVAQVTESNRARLAEVQREADRRAEERVAEARRLADEHVERERAAARGEADKALQEAEAQAAQELASARQDAEAAQQRAEELQGQSRERIASARQLAEEAMQAARAAAAEVQGHARQLTEDVAHQADGDLASHSKQQLLDIAAAMEIEGRTTMTKEELVSAITEATRTVA